MSKVTYFVDSTYVLLRFPDLCGGHTETKRRRKTTRAHHVLKKVMEYNTIHWYRKMKLRITYHYITKFYEGRLFGYLFKLVNVIYFYKKTFYTKMRFLPYAISTNNRLLFKTKENIRKFQAGTNKRFSYTLFFFL